MIELISSNLSISIIPMGAGVVPVAGQVYSAVWPISNGFMLPKNLGIDGTGYIWKLSKIDPQVGENALMNFYVKFLPYRQMTWLFI